MKSKCLILGGKLFVPSPERRTDKTSHGELQSAAVAQMC